MNRWAVSLILFSAAAVADPAQHQVEIQKALMQRDRQSAEFSRPELRDLHSQQERRMEVRPDERVIQARERDALPTAERPAVPARYYRALPLPSSFPRGPRHGVDPIPVQGVGG